MQRCPRRPSWSFPLSQQQPAGPQGALSPSGRHLPVFFLTGTARCKLGPWCSGRRKKKKTYCFPLYIKGRMPGTSLKVQRVRLSASNAEGVGSIPGQRTKIPRGMWKGQEKNTNTHTQEKPQANDNKNRMWQSLAETPGHSAGLLEQSCLPQGQALAQAPNLGRAESACRPCGRRGHYLGASAHPPSSPVNRPGQGQRLVALAWSAWPQGGGKVPE